MVELRSKGCWRRKLWILLACGIAVVLILTLLREHEPRYEGRPLSEWVGLLDIYKVSHFETDPRQAIQQIGTNGLPFLLRWIQYQQRPWRTRLANLCGRLPGKLGEIADDLVRGRGEQRRGEAFGALYLLGPLAKPAVPILTRQLRDPFPDNPISVLVHIGDAALPPILTIVTNPAESPALRTALITHIDLSWPQFTQTNAVKSVLMNCVDDTNFDIAVSAAGVLSSHYSVDEHAMGVLGRAVEDTTKRSHQIAMKYSRECLRHFPTVTVIQYLQDTNSPFSAYAAEALAVLAENASVEKASLPQSVVPALTNSLCDPRPLVRAYSANALGVIHDAPETIVPALLEAWNDPDKSVRSAATNAVLILPPYYHLSTILRGTIGFSPQQMESLARRYEMPDFSFAMVNLLTHPDIRIRDMATNAFHRLKGSNVVNQTSENASRQP
jgi:hypothetical protein